ncbi:GNAT family N-acetyltransferase [Pedobacter mucosus]|uniref:GNAT family N-acetyltransferase n=1 Tax=Pedobacter mucosus TaxID=2895286 RepID=UPI001EE457AE|nr:GNAT family N-acetyltransferase [Pedobacter mucosus]UKT63047.1 GNAT family N-acetyltransferase [Pedobacter mucosus]
MTIIFLGPKFLIRQFQLSEEKIFCSFFDDEEVMRYLPLRTNEEYKKLFKAALGDYKEGPLGRWGIFDLNNGDYIGNCLLRKLAENPVCLEIGYSIGKVYWGKGIGSEVAKAIVDYAFSHTDTNELVALTEAENIGSQRILEKVGFHRNSNIQREGVDLYLFRLIRSV